MKKLIPFLFLTSLVSIFGCSSRVKHCSITLENSSDSIFYNCISEYSKYLESDGDSNFALTIEFSESNDTLSYLINCNSLDDISVIVRDTLSNIYIINKHSVFSKTDIFKNHSLINFDDVLNKMDQLSYKRYKTTGELPGMNVIWDCMSLYLVIKNNRVLRKELRFISGKPEMWKNTFFE